MSYSTRWINNLREDLDILHKEEKYQRHEPEYYAEHVYYNEFFSSCPNEVMNSPAMNEFFAVYRAGGSLYESIKAFLEAYDKENYINEV